MVKGWRWRLLGMGFFIITGSASAQPKDAKPPSNEAARFFETKVRPILAEHCFRCHAAEKQKGHLRLDSRAAIVAGGDRGSALSPGDPGKSLLLRAILYQDDELKMPPNKKLAREHIDILTQWVKLGAPWPGADSEKPVVPTKKSELHVTAKDRSHWSFQPVKRPAPPPVKNGPWVKNPIDAFILARLEAKNMTPNPPASPQQLIRRLYFDLTGLPPTPQDVETFLNDKSSQAYEKLVERLLASPHYGEKWARHWLDLVRYAETNSYERDNPKPHAWRYRDYVIRAFNQDKPFDRFLLEQLAGDELPDKTSDALIATGFYRLGVWDDEPTDRLQARFDGLDDILATTGQALLGLTLDCARCHDHKIDPIPQRDYYRFLAFFTNINHFKNGGPTDEVPIDIPPEDYAQPPPAIKSAKKNGKPTQPMALCVTEAGRKVVDTHILLRGNPQAQGDRVEPGFPLIFDMPAPTIPELPDGVMSSGRRTVLAQWLTSPKNPLTSRVFVNRLWQHHFGRGIVRSANDFGFQGTRPTHPELLDWLAASFVEQGWSIKKIHRLILTSSAYRMSSRGRPDALKVDPENDLFWRFDMRRLSAEEIRDAILAVSGSLNPQMHGPSVYPEIPREVLQGQSMPGRGWPTSTPEQQNRRSVYIHVKRSLLYPLLDSFDLAEPDRTTPVRFSTTQPTQALGMLNSDFLNKQASILARRLEKDGGADLTSQVRLGLYLATSRAPTVAEIQRAVALIETLKEEDGLTRAAALRTFCLVVLNMNEFLYLD